MASLHHRSLIAPRHPRFTIGRDHHGWWVVHDRLGRVGGLFASEDAALHFASGECGRHPEEICRAPADTAVELDRFTADRPHATDRGAALRQNRP